MFVSSPCQLPKVFVPDKTMIIIGRGKKCVQHEGNKNLRRIIQKNLTAYKAAKSKAQKSDIILEVLNEVRGNNLICFVKHDPSDNSYTAVEDATARVTIAQAFRNELSDSYRSSKQFKQKKRLEMNGASSSSDEESQASSSSSSRGIKRARLETTTAFDPSLTLLRVILEGASYIGAHQEEEELTFAELQQEEAKAEDNDTFTSLFQLFGNSNSFSTDNPFEPAPILSSIEPNPIRSSTMAGPFPMTESTCLKSDSSMNTLGFSLYDLL
jgi:hypothetical protein